MNIQVGDIFGDWIIIKQGDGKQYKNEKTLRKTWICKCLCGFCDGEIREVIDKNLKNGGSNGCGRKHKILIGKNNKKYNKFELKDEIAIGITTKGKKFEIDIDDYNIIKEYCWSVLSRENQYLITKVKKDEKYSTIFMHNLIMNNIDKNYVVDHIDGNLFNNKKNNLRLCLQSHNIKNTKLSIANKTGVKGVYWNKRISKYIANIQCDNKKIYLGCFDELENAKQVRKKAEIKYFGEFSRDYRLEGLF